ncbi:MAG: V-type ATP synthase subunit F [Clostridiales bacterium]|nr:V-type ATP synthase subunit F [Clostridiales bacterium]
MYKIGIIGSSENTQIFNAVGISPYKEGEEYAVIFITEDAYEENLDFIKECDDKSTPAIIVLPSSGESRGIGLENVRRSIERAVGADIL